LKKAWLFIAVTLALDAVVGLAGGMLSDRWLRRHQPALVGFAAGALLTAAFVDILPSSVEAIGRDALTWAFVGFIAFAAIEWLVGHHHHQQGAEHTKTLPASLLLADALHNVGDGAAVAAAFLTSTRAGIAVALAVVAHEVPQEVGDFVVLRAAGLRRGAALAALAAVQLAAVVGAVVVVMAAESFGRAIHVVLSLAAGTFLYIGATDLLPELHSGHTTADRRERMFGFVAGIVVVLIASAVAGGLTETGSVRL
jgi:zinc and cadmium transporter